ncbi:DUF2500 domain-containing protein [Cohnella thermotolerans]|uniref:DUF2500 domain-containing protein n=1 Tax=Cohnella thermotolerans TaxID=329858 RepID=UPI000413F923|nr:DUF2500 domain-containing protein [Cohnella thermotolerans]
MNGFGEEPGFAGLFRDMPIVFKLFFFGIAGIIAATLVYAIVSGIVRWSRNNASPLLTETSKVVAKRTEMSGGSEDSSARTYYYYYVTFEFAEGDRVELQVAGHQFGLIAEGDVGRLTYQGTRFKGFDRLKGEA